MAKSDWHMSPELARVASTIQEMMPETTYARGYQRGDVRVMVTKDAGRWHLSASCAYRYPTYDEIADARYDLLADNLEMVMVLPPAANYVNSHPYTFHLWEMHDPEMPIERDPTGTPRTKDGIE